MAEDNVASAVAYYKAMGDKDLSGMARHLDHDVRFIGPMADMTGKEAVLEAAKRLLPLFNSLRIRAKFGFGDQAMLAYDLDCAEPIGVFRVAVLMTLKNSLIARIELFYDPRPFEKREVFSSP
jgi:hypothetical protein